MQVLTNKGDKQNWNASLYSIKRDVHNINQGLNISGLNRVWKLFANAYNRCIRLIKEMDMKYNPTFVAPNGYYDEINENAPLVEFNTSNVVIDLKLSKSNKIPKFNVPLMRLENAVSRFESTYGKMTRDYSNKANAAQARVVKTTKTDDNDHKGAYYDFIGRLNQYATPEQIAIAQEAVQQATYQTISITAEEQSQSLSDVIDTMEEAKENVEQATGTDLNDIYGDPGNTAGLSDAEIDQRINDFREAEAAAEAAAREAAEAAQRDLEEKEQAVRDAAAEYDEKAQEAKEAGQTMLNDAQIADDLQSAMKSGESKTFTDSEGTTWGYDADAGSYTKNGVEISSDEMINGLGGVVSRDEAKLDAANGARNEARDTLSELEKEYNDAKEKTGTDGSTDKTSGSSDWSGPDDDWNAGGEWDDFW